MTGPQALSQTDKPEGVPAYAAANGLLLKQWSDSAAVVFHPASNTTHLVGQNAAQLLAALISRPAQHAAADGAHSGPVHDEDTVSALLQAGMISRVVV